MQQKRPRGFIMLAVLALIAVLVVTLSAMLTSNLNNHKIARRQVEDARARGIAEMCLSKGVAIAVGHFQLRGGEDFDFDQLLDPNATPNDSDDYTFDEWGAVRIHIPSSSTDTLRSYTMIRADGGACYLRFDDNNDDSLPGYTAQTSNTPDGVTPVIEGAGVNVPFRDRDASIAVTAIGVYPAPLGTADGSIYDNAHARVTMRQFFTATASPAVYGNADVRIAGNTRFCGTGGIRGLDVDVDTSSCICGDAYAADFDPNTIIACTAAECPDASAGSVNVWNTLPIGAPLFATEFPTRCAPFGLTEGEAPPPVQVFDTVANLNYNPMVTSWGVRGTGTANTTLTALEAFRDGSTNPQLRLYFRSDGRVFAWDGRALPPAGNAATRAAATSCDLTDPGDAFAPPAVPAAVRNTYCNTLAAGSTCAKTGDPRDKEYCSAPAPAGTRCDQYDQPGIYAWDPSTIPVANQNAFCNAVVPGATCGLVAPTDPALAVDEVCVPPPNAFGAVTDCDPVPGTIPPPVAWWHDIDQDLTGLPGADIVDFATSADMVAAGHPVGWWPGNLQSFCWRMVANLSSGTVGTDAPQASSFVVTGAAAQEWKTPAGEFAITSRVVPNLRADPDYELRDSTNTLVVSTIDDIMSLRLPNQVRAANPTVFPAPGVPQPVATYSAGTWSTPNGWDNPTEGRLPTPAFFIVNGVLDVGSNTRLDAVELLVNDPAPGATPSVRIRGGSTSMLVPPRMGLTQAANNPLAYSGGATRCTREVAEHVLAAWTTNGGRRSRWIAAAAALPNLPTTNVGGFFYGNYVNSTVSARDALLIHTNGACQIDDTVVTYGRIVCGGDVDWKGSDSCVVGGISAGGNASLAATFDASCAAGAVSSCAAASTSLCIEERIGYLGDMFSVDAISIPDGIFIGRGNDPGTGTNPPEKVSKVISQNGNVCLNGPARVLGQVVSAATGGTIQIGSDVLFLHSGEVGLGFGTKRSVWSDNSW